MNALTKTAAMLVAVAVLTVPTVACDARQGRDASSNSVTRHITISDERVGAIATDGGVAWIDDQGHIEIDASELDLSPEQRELAADYHHQAMALQGAAKAIGLQGARVAGTAIRDVAHGLTSGDPDAIGERIETEANAIEVKARQLCRQLRQLRDTQDALGSAVPEFRPYGTIDAKTADQCDSA